MVKVMITGGSGYIGSHLTAVLLDMGYQVVVLDNLINSTSESLRQVRKITGREPVFYEGDIRDEKLLRKIFGEHKIHAVFHLAGLKSIPESFNNVELYHENNVEGSRTLLRIMEEFGIYRCIFSSSASVYGAAPKVPVTEDSVCGETKSPYAHTKYLIENILRAKASENILWQIGILRYFNPAGAHSSGLIGDNPRRETGNLFSIISYIARGYASEILIYGNDYNTPDGTGVRDYVHVMDLALGHLNALNEIQNSMGVRTWNLGTGKGYSVLEIINAFQLIGGIKLPYRFVPRREGDIDVIFSDVSRAQKEINWIARRNLGDIISDTLRWVFLNP